jgi:hypothetical protein
MYLEVLSKHYRDGMAIQSWPKIFAKVDKEQELTLIAKSLTVAMNARLEEQSLKSLGNIGGDFATQGRLVGDNSSPQNSPPHNPLI